MERDIAAAVSHLNTATVAGRFQRYVSLRQEPLRGSRAGGHWGTEDAYPILYLGRPTDSVIVEAYRHLVKTVEKCSRAWSAPRHLVTYEVKITNVLDLRQDASPSRCSKICCRKASGLRWSRSRPGSRFPPTRVPRAKTKTERMTAL